MTASLDWTYLNSLKYDETIAAGTIDTEITGMRYYCGPEDTGPVNGVIIPESGNTYDPKAQMAVRSDGKKLGYIPRFAIPQYEQFNKRNLVCPFAGRIMVDQRGMTGANIRVVLPQNRSMVEKTLSDYMNDK